MADMDALVSVMSKLSIADMVGQSQQKVHNGTKAARKAPKGRTGKPKAFFPRCDRAPQEQGPNKRIPAGYEADNEVDPERMGRAALCQHRKAERKKLSPTTSFR